MKTQKKYYETLLIVFLVWMLNPSELISADYFPAGNFGPDTKYYYHATKQCVDPEKVYFSVRSVLRIQGDTGKKAIPYAKDFNTYILNMNRG